MRMLTHEEELALRTQERDEARGLVTEFRQTILELQARASRAEGESAARQGTIEALTNALELLRSERTKASMEARIAELEKEINQCLVRMTEPSVVLQDRGRT
jgi:uncharacterized coiled-coil DUF342 family protein